MYSFPMKEQEIILRKGMANLYYEGDAFQGALYLTDERVIFVGHLSDITRKYMVDIPLSHIAAMTTGRSLYIVPNILCIRTIRSDSYKFIVKQRDSWHTAIQGAVNRH